MTRQTKDIILEPLITEKSTALAVHNRYTFKVATSASKPQIRKAFEEIFPNRKVLSIQTLKLKGHAKRTKSGVKLPKDGKKAVISCEGAKIEYFPESGA